MRIDKDKENDKILAAQELKKAPTGVDRRRFLMRSATKGAAAVLTGCTTQDKTAQAGGETPAAPSPAQVALAAPSLSADLNVVNRAKEPVITVLDEFYRVGPGPSSPHTIGPIRITYDFYQRRSETSAGKHQCRSQRVGDDAGRYRQHAGLHHRCRSVRSHEHDLESLLQGSKACPYHCRGLQACRGGTCGDYRHPTEVEIRSHFQEEARAWTGEKTRC